MIFDIHIQFVLEYNLYVLGPFLRPKFRGLNVTVGYKNRRTYRNDLVIRSGKFY